MYKAIELYDEKGKLVKTKEFFCYFMDFDQDCFKVVFDEADSIDDALQIPRKDVAIIRLAIHF